MNSAKLIYISVFLCLQVVFAIDAFDDAFFSLNARAMALGNSGAAQIQGIGSAYLNPTNIINQNTKLQIYHSSARVFEDYQYYNFGVVNKLDDRLYFGFTVIGAEIGNIPRVEKINDRPEVLFNTSSIRNTIMGSIAFIAKDQLIVGSNFKFYQQTLFDARATGMSMDFGISYLLIPGMRLGLNWRNLIGNGLNWSTGSRDDFIQEKQLGVSWQKYLWQKRVIFNLDTIIYGHLNTNLLGIECWLTDQLALRSGMDSEQWSVGLGIIIDNIKLDYVYSLHEYLNSSHKLSMSAGF